MKDVAIFDLDEVIPVGDGEIVAVLTLVGDDDEIPPIVATIETCPECGAMARDLRRHRCYR